ncbi:MAG: hypothetical protein ABI273_20560 [Lacunisphaera sp.]
MMFLGHRLKFVQLSCSISVAAASLCVLAPTLFAQSALQREQAEVSRRVANERYNSTAAVEQRSQEHHDATTRMRDAMRGYSDNVRSSGAEVSIWEQAEQAAIEKESARLRAAQEAEAAKRRAAEEKQEAIYRANNEQAKAEREKAEAARLSRLSYWQMNRGEGSNYYNLCLVYLGIHPDFQLGPNSPTRFENPVTAREFLKEAIASNNPDVLALVWDAVVAKGPHEKLFKVQELEWYNALTPQDDGSLAPVGDFITGDWLRASLSDRVLAVPKLKQLHALALRWWQREVSRMILKYPPDADRIFKVMGTRLPERLLSQLSVQATGTEATSITNCLMAYAILCSRHNGFAKDAELTRRALALAEKQNSPFLLYKLYSLSDDPRRWPALRAALAEKAPSAECLRTALGLASQDPELIRLRAADPDLLSEQASVREISQYAMMLASLDEPFSRWENDAPLAGTLADLAARSLFHKELTAAIPVLVDKARKAHCELLAMQLGLVETGLIIRQGQLNQTNLPRLRKLALENIPGNKLSYDDLLGFTPSQAAACLQAPQTRAAVLDLMRALAGYGSWKATEALRLAGDNGMKPSDTGPKPTALPL